MQKAESYPYQFSLTLFTGLIKFVRHHGLQVQKQNHGYDPAIFNLRC